jgi:mitogen-activated protein kinase binding protein 1
MQQQQHPLPVPARTRLTLERVLGVTSLSNAMLAVNPTTGEIAYAAGCIVVIYNLRRNKQVRYYRVEKSVACLCFSPSGQFLAIGEKGYLPAITIWDGSDGTLCAELPLHKYGVACMAFSRDSAYLVSVGLVHDQQLVAWDLSRDAETGQMKGAPVGVAVVEEKVLAMDYCHEGNFFVTVGEKHFKVRLYCHSGVLAIGI